MHKTLGLLVAPCPGLAEARTRDLSAGDWFTYAADVRARYQGMAHPPVVPTETLLVAEALALRGALRLLR